MQKTLLILFTAILFFHLLPSEGEAQGHSQSITVGQADTFPFLVVLGNVQDAGSPHAACKKDCCRQLFDHPDPDRMVVCLGIVDPSSGESWLIEASPDLPRQMKWLSKLNKSSDKETPDAIFLTHAHIGHYTGLQYLGRESMNANEVPVYAMPRMKFFLENNGPWDQLLELHNIRILDMMADSTISLSDKISITPIRVPHRDEYSETVGFVVEGPRKRVIFIPDIDKWDLWGENISEWIGKVDYAFLDATFYDQAEVQRDMSEIPHPFVVESMDLFGQLSRHERNKVHFIHLNHSNPLLRAQSSQSRIVSDRGYRVARFGQIFGL